MDVFPIEEAPHRNLRTQADRQSGVVFDDEMAGLAERLAANAPEIWAQQRIRDGWTYGPTRGNEAKEHPCLVPYGELPDSEKEYDRVMGGRG